jgi:hypothetical protein
MKFQTAQEDSVKRMEERLKKIEEKNEKVKRNSMRFSLVLMKVVFMMYPTMLPL